MTEHKQLLAEVEPWLKLCGACDAGLTMNCTCPKGDYRAVLAKVMDAYVAALSIEEQVKPAIEEPLEFGSIVRASAPQCKEQLWTPAPYFGEHYWMAESRRYEVWPELTDVEVLRVGLGDDAYENGARDLAAQIHKRLLNMLEDAITSERKNALEKAIQAVEELAP